MQVPHGRMSCMQHGARTNSHNSLASRTVASAASIALPSPQRVPSPAPQPPPPPPPSRTLHSLPVAPSRALSQKLSSAKDNTKPLKKRGLKVKEYLHLKGDRGVRKQEGPKRQPNNDCHMSQAARHLDQDARRIRNLALWIRMQSLTVIEITTREIRQANRP